MVPSFFVTNSRELHMNTAVLQYSRRCAGFGESLSRVPATCDSTPCFLQKSIDICKYVCKYSIYRAHVPPENQQWVSYRYRMGIPYLKEAQHAAQAACLGTHKKNRVQLLQSEHVHAQLWSIVNAIKKLSKIYNPIALFLRSRAAWTVLTKTCNCSS